jgi:AcrR family transcriptional regulator
MSCHQRSTIMSVPDIKYDRAVGRWEPDAQGRLEKAALELYVEHGFDQTTVADIASRAGLTERTFFRYFSDKREVLFSGAGRLQELLVAAVSDAPSARSPLDAVAEALEQAAQFLGTRPDQSQLRQAVIVATPELRERELIKMATLASAIAQALRDRGVGEPAASLTAESGIAVFKIAFGRWVEGTGSEDLSEAMRESFAELRAVTAER